MLVRVQGHGAEEVDDGRGLSHVLDGVKGSYWVVGCDDAIARVGEQKGLLLVGQACDKRPLLVGDFAVQGSLDEMVLVVSYRAREISALASEMRVSISRTCLSSCLTRRFLRSGCTRRARMTPRTYWSILSLMRVTWPKQR